MAQFDAKLESRLLRYAAIDCQSDEDSPTAPSTQIQFAMLHLLCDELAGKAQLELKNHLSQSRRHVPPSHHTYRGAALDTLHHSDLLELVRKPILFAALHLCLVPKLPGKAFENARELQFSLSLQQSQLSRVKLVLFMLVMQLRIWADGLLRVAPSAHANMTHIIAFMEAKVASTSQNIDACDSYSEMTSGPVLLSAPPSG